MAFLRLRGGAQWALLVSTLSAATGVDAQQPGSIAGLVSDLSGAPYVGAEVAVTGLGLRTETDEQGRYRILGVPAGTHTVRVRYLSAATATETAEVAAGATVELDFALRAYAEEIEVVATPLLEGQAAALNQQKHAVNIVNIVSADQIGRFPDPNAAEATQRVPAVTLQRDQGEGRYVIVRGTEARLNSTTVDGELERGLRDRLQQSKIDSVTLGGASQRGGSHLLEYRVAYNRSREETPNEIESVFVQEDVEFAPNVSPDSIDPDDIRANPLNEDLEAYELDGIEFNPHEAEEEDAVGAVDFSRGFFRDAGLSGSFKLGAKARFKEKVQNSDVFEFDPEEDYALLELLSGFRSQTPFLDGRYEIGPFPDPQAMRRLLASGAFEEERDLEEDLADFTANEDTLAAYGMTELYFGESTMLLAGLRAESTETDYDAFELEMDEEGDPVALSPVSGGTDYTELLPMVHLRYRLDDDTNLRAALTRTLARPNFIDLAPFQLVLREDEEIERGNPNLDVTTAWNLDLAAERYFEPVGILSVGVFYKRLTDNVFTFRSEEIFDGDTFDVTQKRNGDEARVLGAEVALHRRFDSGFGIFFNYTHVDSEADYPDREPERLQGQAEQVGNLALSFERGRLSTQASLNYHDEYILEIGEEPAEDLYIDEQLQLDFTATVRLSNRFSLSLQLNNLTDEPYRVYEGLEDRPIQEEYYSWWGTLGLKLDL